MNFIELMYCQVSRGDSEEGGLHFILSDNDDKVKHNADLFYFPPILLGCFHIRNIVCLFFPIERYTSKGLDVSNYNGMMPLHH